MRNVTKKAKLANSRSQMCKHCPLLNRRKVCHPTNLRVCSDAFIEGYKKGVKAAEEEMKKSLISKAETKD